VGAGAAFDGQGRAADVVRRLVALLVVCVPGFAVPPSPARAVPASSLPAFPGAEGFGSTTPGGRGGVVMEVTNLHDAGTGSFRACAEATGPRICVFRIGGTVVVRSEIEIAHPYLTVAGQTAPGGGISVRSSPTYRDPTLKITTHDVILRGVRVRTGASTAKSPQRRSLSMENGAHDIIVDHCSFSWATDEIVTIIDGAHDITIQWSIIAEGLAHSTHTKGEHSKAMLISGKRFRSRLETARISVHHNLFAHNADRNPRNAGDGLVDLVNNVVYDWRKKATQVDDHSGSPTLNAVGNYYLKGPTHVAKFENYVLTASRTGGRRVGIYVYGNLGPTRTRAGEPQENVVPPAERGTIVRHRYPAPTVSTTSARRAYDDVLMHAGARVPMLDPVDRQVINDVEHRTGHIIDDPSEVGGWPYVAAGVAPADGDHDGMPDQWEHDHHLALNVDDSAERDRDGYTNIEEYLNGLLTAVTPHRGEKAYLPSARLSTRDSSDERSMRPGLV
jgi:pectate lyase